MAATSTPKKTGLSWQSGLAAPRPKPTKPAPIMQQTSVGQLQGFPYMASQGNITSSAPVAPATTPPPGQSNPTPATPPAAATPAATTPFHTGPELMGQAGWLYQQGMGAADADYSLAQTAAQVASGRVTTNTNARRDTSSANDSAGARGVWGSSINQGDVATIEGARQQALNDLDTQLANATLHHNAVLAAITGANTLYGQGFNQTAVENANAQDRANGPESMPTPAPTQSSAPAAPAAQSSAPAAPAQSAATQSKRPTGGDWDGSNVFQQSAGTRAGQWYRVVKQGSKTYRFYQNGDKVLING